jgi:hypothetical protein
VDHLLAPLYFHVMVDFARIDAAHARTLVDDLIRHYAGNERG